jgi:hypothetical protein
MNNSRAGGSSKHHLVPHHIRREQRLYLVRNCLALLLRHALSVRVAIPVPAVRTHLDPAIDASLAQPGEHGGEHALRRPSAASV